MPSTEPDAHYHPFDFETNIDPYPPQTRTQARSEPDAHYHPFDFETNIDPYPPWARMQARSEPDAHYHPFDFETNIDPYPPWARMQARVALDEGLDRWAHRELDMDNAVRARTSTVRGWESLPVLAR